MKRVLLLYHAWNNRKALLGDLLDEHHIAYDTIDVEHEPIADPTGYAAVIGFGGPQNLYKQDSYPYLLREKEVLRLIVEKEIPYLGICLGGQLLADALGGQVKPHTFTEIGFFDVQLTAEGKRDPLFASLPGYQRVFHWHEDTFDLPPDAVLLATSDVTEHQAFRYGRQAYGLQYHIELDEQALDRWLYHPSTKGQILNTLGTDGYSTLEKTRAGQFPLYSAHTRIVMNNFLRMSSLL